MDKPNPHNGRWSVTTGNEAEPHSVLLRVYTYTREDKIIATSGLRLTRREVRALLAAMDRADEEQSQMALPWATDPVPDSNVRFLPPER